MSTFSAVRCPCRGGIGGWASSKFSWQSYLSALGVAWSGGRLTKFWWSCRAHVADGRRSLRSAVLCLCRRSDNVRWPSWRIDLCALGGWTAVYSLGHALSCSLLRKVFTCSVGLISWQLKTGLLWPFWWCKLWRSVGLRSDGDWLSWPPLAAASALPGSDRACEQGLVL